MEQSDYDDSDIEYLFSSEYQKNPIFPSFNPRKWQPEVTSWNLFPDLISLLSRNPENRPKLRNPLNKLYFTAFDAPSFSSLNSFDNHESFDNWLIKLYSKMSHHDGGYRELLKCFLSKLEYEHIKGRSDFISNLV